MHDDFATQVRRPGAGRPKLLRKRTARPKPSRKRTARPKLSRKRTARDPASFERKTLDSALCAPAKAPVGFRRNDGFAWLSLNSVRLSRCERTSKSNVS